MKTLPRLLFAFALTTTAAISAEAPDLEFNCNRIAGLNDVATGRHWNNSKTAAVYGVIFVFSAFFAAIM